MFYLCSLTCTITKVAADFNTAAGIHQGSSSDPVGISKSNPNVADHPNEPAFRECDEEPSAKLDSASASYDKESVDEPFAEAACGGDVAAARSLFKPHPLKNFFRLQSWTKAKVAEVRGRDITCLVDFVGELCSLLSCFDCVNDWFSGCLCLAEVDKKLYRSIAENLCKYSSFFIFFFFSYYCLSLYFYFYFFYSGLCITT
jgi:hypothetical protein